VSRASDLGAAGEDAASAYLKSIGYRIVTRNLRGPGGEIDIVARDGETIVFVEVKARTSRRFGSALGAVDARKRARLRSVAADYRLPTLGSTVNEALAAGVETKTIWRAVCAEFEMPAQLR